MPYYLIEDYTTKKIEISQFDIKDFEAWTLYILRSICVDYKGSHINV